MTKKEIALKAVSVLKERYPDAVCSLVYEHPYQLMIAVRLSAQCTDARVNIVTKPLFEKYPTLQDFANANLEELEEIVKPCGFYKMKAKSIKEASGQLLHDFGGVIPDNMNDLSETFGSGAENGELVIRRHLSKACCCGGYTFYPHYRAVGRDKGKRACKSGSRFEETVTP